jgi:hypothetical protein
MRMHTLLWLLAMVLIFLFSPLVTSPDRYIAAIDREVEQSAQWYAYSELDRITANGESLYRFLMVSSGIDPAIKKHMIREAPSKEMAPGAKLPDHITKWADQFLDYWASLLCNMHLFCFRLAHSMVWLGYLLPFLAAIIFDGVMTRQAKIESFKYTSPTIYNISWHLYDRHHLLLAGVFRALHANLGVLLSQHNHRLRPFVTGADLQHSAFRVIFRQQSCPSVAIPPKT